MKGGFTFLRANFPSFPWILARIAKAFPSDQKIYGAAHKEQAYTNKKHGELIPYTDAESITAV
jgi:transposase